MFIETAQGESRHTHTQKNPTEVSWGTFTNKCESILAVMKTGAGDCFLHDNTKITTANTRVPE